MTRLIRLPLAAALLLTLACQQDTVQPSIGAPWAELRDGAHEGPNLDFFFLPPIVDHPGLDPASGYDVAEFNRHLGPRVEIEECEPPDPGSQPACTPFRTFSSSEIQLSNDHYGVNWDTHEGTGLRLDRIYRINVLLGELRLGFADVFPVANGSGLRNVEDDYIGLVDGRTLPIPFAIQNGATCGGGQCSAATINFAAGGVVELFAENELFRLEIDPNTQATSGGETIEEATFTLELCEGINVDLPLFGKCLRIATFFETTVAAPLQLTPAALVGFCSFEPGLEANQERLVSLHQRDGNTVRALPHADPECEAAAASAPSAGTVFSWFAGLWRGGQALVARLLSPAPLYANTTGSLAVFNLGGGGETDQFGESSGGAVTSGMQRSLTVAQVASEGANTVSEFQFALPAQLNVAGGTDLGTNTPGTTLNATIVVTDELGAPVANATVRFQDAPPSGGVDGGVTGPSPQCAMNTTELVCTSGGDGKVTVQWTLSATAGLNQLSAKTIGAGLHADLDGNGPFDSCVPELADLEQVHCTGAVTIAVDLTEGVVTFTAAALADAVEQIAFTTDRDGNNEIYAMNTDGSNPTNLSNSAAFDFQHRWSPDGTRFVFTSNRDGNTEIYVMNRNGSGVTRLTNNPADDQNPWWSPDGSMIAFESDRDANNEIYVMNADGMEQTNVSNDPGFDALPTWSANSAQIAFRSTRTGPSNPEGDSEIYIVNVDGTGEPLNLTNDDAFDMLPAWSPTGGQIAFQKGVGESPFEIYVANADGTGEPTNVTNHAADDFDPQWAPDGVSIAFTSERDGNREIYAVSVLTGALARLTEHTATDEQPAWSADGARIAFNSQRDGNVEIYVMDANGTGQSNLTNNAATDQRARWSPVPPAPPIP
ncbi:MAG: TolB family protein [Gemmatimonadales bacterium]